MDFLKRLRKTKQDESGAVTVDWVVLTAAIVVIGSGVVAVIAPGLTSTSNYISSMVDSAHAVADG